MVYKGPSRGCYMCRKRRVKCDEKRPQCGNCVKRQQRCPGYRDFFDAVHKDETFVISQKSGSKRQKRTCALAEDLDGSLESRLSEECIRNSSDESVDSSIFRISNNAWASPALFAQPSRNVAIESLCYFFTNYVNTPRDPSTNIFIEHILPMYLNTPPNSALYEAIHGVAINVTSLWMARHVDSYLAREAYGKAVTRLKALLEDPVQCKTDETLATVFMLDFYDSLNQRFVKFLDTGTHQKGAVALLKYRGKDNFKTPLSQRLFNAMRSRHINYSLQAGKDIQLDPALLADATAVLPSAKLDLLNVELATLHKLAQGGPEALNLSMTEFYKLVLSKALVLEKKFQAWTDSLPISWRPVSISAADLHPSIREAGLYENMCDVYSSLAVSHVNNAARSSHVGALRLIALCLSGLEDLGVAVDPDIDFHVNDRIQSVVDKFCASIPFHLGNRTGITFPHERREYPHIPAELRRLANYVDPFGNEVEMTMEDHARAAAAIGGWFIMTPLAGFLTSPALRSPKAKPGPLMRKLRAGQLAWIRGQMSRIQHIYSFAADGSQRYPDCTRVLKNPGSEQCKNVHSTMPPLNHSLWTV
ncbi:hypothetical protein G647_00735 [Cladophialophora carrionii CBS 160.54]|uniref:Zn(2)-C6 fungal-type domain-containing protein n=1 Tax=Cladophialophora carrionii CBS 160.54 TaxID=1279043 RepID=V9DNN7_9EURO|nr:uncharacterized protein G647_00735 [Cladophialophora carrionii CBS 160.54]ETI28286.1 hypothetical protein G647_00735 [Cladophialophora carrionii CBS 160.54]